MIGNDIVDLHQSRMESDWQRRRFFEKVLSENEQKTILGLARKEDQETAVWLMWTMKETAYKRFMRIENRRFYAPLKFECKLKNFFLKHLAQGSITASVKFKDMTCVTESIIHQDYIYTFTKQIEKNEIPFLNSDGDENQKKKENNFFHNHVFRNNHSDTTIKSKVTRKQLILDFANFKKVKPSTISITKNELGIPQLLLKSQPTETVCSITHHGRYSAVCFQNILA